MLRIFVITILSFMMLTSVAVAQSSNQGAFDKLSPGNQKIAQALFDAEQNNATSPTAKLLSRDDIAAMKQDGKGWGGVFKSMKTQGLVQEKNLGQVVSQANHAAHSNSSQSTMITTGSGRTFVAGKSDHTSASNQQSGGNSGPKGGGAGQQSVMSSNVQTGAGGGHSNAGGNGGRGKN
jgi:hypothetical protein